MKILKYLKYIIAAWLLLTLVICAGGVIKYNIDLNRYIDQEGPKEKRNKPNSLSKETEVYVVGSVHFETDKIKRDDIYNYVDNISPSVILYENNTKTVKRMVNRTDFWGQLMSSFKKGNKVESFVSLRYKKHHPGSEILPFEWEERDAYHAKHNLATNSSKLLGSAIRLNRENLLSSEESAIMDQFQEINKKYNEIGNTETVYDINNSHTDSIIRIRQSYVYKTIPEMVKERNDLAAFKDFLPIHMEYWDTRNKAMTANILNQIKVHPNKRLVVLTGYSHRYYLIDELKKYEDELNFSVKSR
ncbi:hypothetical protein [Robertkochia flava]|uniref:hypothetical protein n=1 Tax=Robertkochia flava TaxID=3447986 RepID=UPI001CCF7A0D|nr:hypothetical protein [Robertkochia marina]